MDSLQLQFILVAAICYFMFFRAVGNSKLPVIITLIWIAVSLSLSYSGFLLDFEAMPPRFLLIVLGAIAYTSYMFNSLKGFEMSLQSLTAVHMIRIPVELCIYQFYLRAWVPEIMTFEGYNLDIIMGISSFLILIYLLVSGKNVSTQFLRYWNYVGIVLLTIIVSMAVLSAPTPLQQLAFEQPNTAVMRFPFVLLPAFIVPAVLLSHLFALRMLNRIEKL